MHRLIALLLSLALALPVAACGSDPQTAQEFCADRGGVNAQTMEPDGDVECQDGTEFEADGDSESSSKKKKKKRIKR